MTVIGGFFTMTQKSAGVGGGELPNELCTESEKTYRRTNVVQFKNKGPILAFI